MSGPRTPTNEKGDMLSYLRPPDGVFPDVRHASRLGRADLRYDTCLARRAEAMRRTIADTAPKKTAAPSAAKDHSPIHAPRELVDESGSLARTRATTTTTAATAPKNKPEASASRLGAERIHEAADLAPMTTAPVRAARQTAVAIHPRVVRNALTGSQAMTRGAKVHRTPA